MKIQLTHNFEDIINIDNLLIAWQEFKKGKGKRIDVGEFEMNLMDNILKLRHDLFNHTYKHGDYQAFNVCDPKPRNIHKATVRDRILHRAVYRILYPFFDRIFISDSFSCRDDKGTHRAINRFRRFTYIGTKNNTCTYWILKCDIKKFFANIDHQILLDVLRVYVPDDNIIQLLKEIIESFSSIRKGVGLPLGNLTSQLFANIYMNELDNFVKHKLKIKHYIRYADDFIVLHTDKLYLENIIFDIAKFLEERLKLILHPDKVFIKTLFSGVDFLGYVNLPHYRVLRTKTKKRMFKRINNKNLQSYLGILSHCNGYKLKNKLICGII
ncbi:MAG: reverse transcriptase domain-containing protein [Patescibacteria group bacterium]